MPSASNKERISSPAEIQITTVVGLLPSHLQHATIVVQAADL